MIRIANKPIATATSPAAAIVRMSSTAQEKSPAEQRAEIVKLAEQCHCKIVRWYEDHGISGDNNRRRDEFNKMCRDAQSPDRDFSTILAWHIDRVSRNDILDAAEWLRPLRKSGVRIITCSQGELDLDSFGGVLTYAIHQQAAHQYLRDLSRNICRSLVSRCKDGKALTRPPYGFDRVFHDAAGREVYRAVFGEKFRKPKDWTVTLVPSSRTELVKTVRWIFDRFTSADGSLRSIAFELNRRGTPSPSGTTWSYQMVKEILANAVYAGDYVFGRSAKGKFYQVGDTGNVVAAAGKRKRPALVVLKNHYPAIVKRSVFRAAQDRLLERKIEKHAPRYGSYLLSSVCKCGHCGGRLVGVSSQGYRYYYCWNSTKGLCLGRRVRAERIEGLLCDFVRDVFLGREHQAALRDALAAKIKQRKRRRESGPLEAELAKLDRKIERGVENLLLAAPADVPQAQKLLAKWRERRASLQADVDAQSVKGGQHAQSVEETVERAMAQLERLAERIKHADPAIAREAFKGLFKQVTLYWHPKTGKCHELARVAIQANSSMRTMTKNTSTPCS